MSCQWQDCHAGGLIVREQAAVVDCAIGPQRRLFHRWNGSRIGQEQQVLVFVQTDLQLVENAPDIKVIINQRQRHDFQAEGLRHQA